MMKTRTCQTTTNRKLEEDQLDERKSKPSSKSMIPQIFQTPSITPGKEAAVVSL
jgi:hypothetical protein